MVRQKLHFQIVYIYALKFSKGLKIPALKRMNQSENKTLFANNVIKFNYVNVLKKIVDFFNVYFLLCRKNCLVLLLEDQHNCCLKKLCTNI